MNDTSAFATLGLPARYDVDPNELEDLYYEACKQQHPDRVAEDARAQAGLRAAAINDAYKTIRNATKRAEHLLALHGVTLHEARVSQGFLVEIMETREALSSAIRDDDGVRVADILSDAERQHGAAVTRIGRAFAAHEESANPSHLEVVCASLVELRYLDRIIETCEESGLV